MRSKCKIQPNFKPMGFLMLFLFSTAFAVSQNKHYLGTEPDLPAAKLLQNAAKANFNGHMAAQIYKDDKNTYYAVNLQKIKSNYLKIRLLEQSYKSKYLVSISANIKADYLLFLVNNTLKKSNTQIVTLLESYLQKAKNEALTMNAEQMRLWLLSHQKLRNND